MTYEEKLQKIITRLKDERDLTRKNHKTRVEFNDNSFTKIRIQETSKILLQLQDDEKVLQVIEAIQPIDSLSTEQIINPSDNDDYEGVVEIVVELDEKFDDWYEKYLMMHKTSLENLDFINILRIYDVVLDINEQIQLINGTTVHIELIPSLIRFRALFPIDTSGFRDEYCDNRINSLKYLKQKDVIEEYNHNQKGWDTEVIISFKLSKFEAFKNKITEAYIAHNKSEKDTQAIDNQQSQFDHVNNKIQKDESKANEQNTTSKAKANTSDIAYEITYTSQRRILINNNTEIGRPDFNSENDLVFSFLYENPNKSFTKEQIEKAIDAKLTKTLHKITENLGFTGDTKKVFMSISKNAIFFRNPVTKQELEDIKKMPLVKNIRGGGELLLLHNFSTPNAKTTENSYD